MLHNHSTYNLTLSINRKISITVTVGQHHIPLKSLLVLNPFTAVTISLNRTTNSLCENNVLENLCYEKDIEKSVTIRTRYHKERRTRRRRRDVMERTEGWASSYTHTYTPSHTQGERYRGCRLPATLVTDWPAGKSPASLNLAKAGFSFIIFSSQLIPIFCVKKIT